MKALEKLLKGRRCLVFLDLEGTQFTHEMIEIGAYKTLIKDDFSVKKAFKGFKSYVKAKTRVGRIVVEITGITDEQIKKEGKPFRLVQQQLKKYVGKEWGHCVFVTFGTLDQTIIMKSADNNLDASKEEARYMAHNCLDLAAFMSRYIKDDNGNPYSLTNLLKVFGVSFEGKAHDALVDAYNLLILYKAFLAKPDIVEAEYKKTLAKITHLPAPIVHTVEKLGRGESVTPEFFEQEIKDSLK